uniref:Uncharacterized protein n=1 Tax=Romanomermis culicivorax TaxID=13658 RepID=A0A915HIR0_ROMCU
MAYDLIDQSTNGNSRYYHRDQLGSASPRITNYIDQWTSATPHIMGTTPQAKTHRETIGPLIAPHHIQLDNRRPQTCRINLHNTRTRRPFLEGPL